MIPTLGQLTEVPLREAWPNEATSFTPWLHEDDNMAALGEALGMESLIPVGRERAVGHFSADLLAEDHEGNRVLIENQLEQSDHDHLGKCLTYAAGLKAKTIVWLCSRIRDEHRAAIDWLNDVSTDDYSFFAVEIELYRIGESVLAPRFNIAANPNNWSREVRQQASRAQNDLTETQKAHIAYWTGLIEAAKDTYDALGRRKAYKGNWQTAESFTVNSDLYFEFNISRSQKGLRSEIYIGGQSAKSAFDWMKHEIVENDLLADLDISWERMEQRRDCRIATYWPNTPSTHSEGHQKEYDFLIKTSKRLSEVGKPLGQMLRDDPTPLQVDIGLEADE